MIKIDNYLIVEEANKITIYLPQLTETMQDTVTPIAKRKIKLTYEELLIIIKLVKSLYEEESVEENDQNGKI